MKIKLFLSICLGAGLSAFAAMSVVAAPPTNSPNLPALQVAATSTPALALSPLVTSTITATVTTTATLSPGNEKIANAIADYFGVDLDEVLDMHDQANGWGQVFFVFALAQVSGESPDDIWALREEGGWGQVIKGLGLKPGNKGNSLGAAVSGKSTPTLVPTSSSSSSSSDINSDNCKGNPNNKGKGNACTNANATPIPSSNPKSNSSGNGNGKGKGPK